MKTKFTVILILLLFFNQFFAQGTYYDNIDPDKNTFITDLQNRIRNPYTWIPYSQYAGTVLANYEAVDNGNGTHSVTGVYSGQVHTYSGNFPGWIPKTPFSREHTFPHSWMPTNPADDPVQRDEYSDQHHLFPAYQNEANAVRSNYPLGIVQNVTSSFGNAKFGTDASGKTVYEPRDEHKGDAARAILYMILRYDGIDGNDWGMNAVNTANGNRIQDINVLLQWHQQDPPDAWEIGRNAYIQSVQGNRNPFVDNPDYVNYIEFGEVEYISHDLYFTEYVEAGSNNKALEIYNNTGNNIDFSTTPYTIEIYANGSLTPTSTIPLSSSVNNDDVLVITNSAADSDLLSKADVTSSNLTFNGDDVVVLKNGSKIVDVIGKIGEDPGTSWTTNSVSTENSTLRRKSNIGIGDKIASDNFDPSVEWVSYPAGTYSDLGNHTVNQGPPTIANVQRDNFIPDANANTVITATVTDDSAVQTVKIKYTIDGGSEQEVIASNTAGDTYQGTIPSSVYTDGSLLRYKVYAEDETGTYTLSSEKVLFVGTTPIEKLHAVDADGKLIYANIPVKVEGVATVETNTFSTTNLDVNIQDETGGITLFKFGSPPNIIRGNKYSVVGALAQYNGKTEIIPASNNDITDLGSAVEPEPIIVTIEQLLANPEFYEGKLIGIQHVTKTSGTWPSSGKSTNLQMTDDGGTNSLTMRIDSDTELDGTSEPAWQKDIVGIFNQYDKSPPYTGGYQIMPRDANDILDNGALPVELTTFTASIVENSVELKWETATEVNNYGFDIERKSVKQIAGDLSNYQWEKISFVNGYGNSNSPKYYVFTDDEVKGSSKYSYRLKQIDFDGKYEYSDIVEVNFGIPQDYVLNQNYPNPFNPTTKIEFSLPKDGNVKITIFNLLGEEVAELLNKNLSAGNHSVKFDASEFNSGIYFCKLESGNFSQIRKMILIK